MDERSVDDDKHDDDDDDDRLSRLENRLARLERMLGVSTPESPATTPAPAPIAPLASPHVLKPPPLPARSAGPSQNPSQRDWRELWERQEERATAASAAATTTPAASATSSQPIPVEPIPELEELPRRASSSSMPSPSNYQPPTSHPATLEAVLGLKWTGWVGAIIVVIGAALGVKYAYDHDWFSVVPPAARLALLSLGGFGLIAAGEVVYRRVGALAAAGLFGAGVATLFVVSYAGYAYFGLYDRDAAFVGMALITLIGCGVAVRGDMVSIAVLAIVGGNVAPLLLGSNTGRLVPLLAYLLMLQAVALFLSWRGKSQKWWTLRGVAFATICLWMLLPLAEPAKFSGDAKTQALFFAVIYAALFHLELALSSLRMPVENTTREPDFTVPVPLGARDVHEVERGVGVTFSFLVTAALTIAALALVWDSAEIVRGAWTLGIGAVCFAIGLTLAKFARGRDPLAPPVPAEALSLGYKIQALALLVIAVPVTLSGVWVTVAWAVMAIAFAVIGATLNLSASRVLAVILWMLAVGHLGTWTLGASIVGSTTGPHAVWAVVLGTQIPAYLVLAMLMAVVGHGIAAIVREDFSAVSVAPEQPPAPPAANAESAELSTTTLNYESRATAPPRPGASRAFQSLAATTDALAVLAVVAAVFAALPPVGTSIALLCYGWVLIAAGQVVRSPEMQPAGLLLLFVVSIKWLFFDTLRDHVAFGGRGLLPAASAYRPLYNPLAAIGVAIFLSGLAVMRIPLKLRGPAAARNVETLRAVGGFGAVLVLLWLATMEIDRYFNSATGATATAGLVGNTADPARAEQFAISIFWSLYAVGCVVLGFAKRVAGLRYFGLTLFGITIAKVMIFDLASVQTGYRILSFLALGLLLLGTSVLYGKLSPILLGPRTQTRTDDDYYNPPPEGEGNPFNR